MYIVDWSTPERLEAGLGHLARSFSRGAALEAQGDTAGATAAYQEGLASVRDDADTLRRDLLDLHAEVDAVVARDRETTEARLAAMTEYQFDHWIS